MTLISPVTEVAPESEDVLEKSGLPFGFAITPFADRSALSKGDDDKYYSKKYKKDKSFATKKELEKAICFPTKASLIAKCTSCGSPLNPNCVALGTWSFICTICGNAYDADFDTQYDLQQQSSKYQVDDDHETLEMKDAEYTHRYRSQHVEQEERIDYVVEYSLPVLHLKNPANQRMEEIFALPASACPPLLAVMIDGTSSDAYYYEYIASSLQTLLDDESGKSKGARMAIFVMTTNGGLSVFDFSTPGAHLKHLFVDDCPLDENPKYQGCQKRILDDFESLPLSQFFSPEEIFSPIDGMGKLNIENALRQLADSGISIQQCCQRQCGNDDIDAPSLGSTLQTFLEFIEETAFHPGEQQNLNIYGNSNDDMKPEEKFLYCGGKIMCFLSKAPVEIGKISLSGRNGKVGRGGFGGACAEVGKRYKTHPITYSKDAHTDLDDIEAGGTNRTSLDVEKTTSDINIDETLPEVRYERVDEYYQDIGINGTISAFSVEIFGFVKEDDFQDGDYQETYFGFPLLKYMSERSGGCGPLMINIARPDESKTNFVNELKARCPWTRQHAFGSMLRIRTSDSLSIDKSQTGKYETNGMFGSFTSSPDDEELYMFGAIENSHTNYFNLEIVSKSGKVESFVTLDSGREFSLKPTIQSCFAYTATVLNGNSWITVRRLRVATYSLDLTNNIEELTSSLDLEVLAVSLFHTLYGYSQSNELSAVEEFANDNLIYSLLCCYMSAKSLSEKSRSYGDGIVPDNFYASSRIIKPSDQDTEKKKKLLAHGHDVLKDLPLLFFSLIQCDALRPRFGEFNPSIDAQTCAAANMMNMKPEVLSRCVAPRIELWLANSPQYELLYDNVNMNISDISEMLTEHHTNEIPILLVDSSYSVFLYDCKGIPSYNMQCDEEVDLPLSLLERKNEYLNDYRVTPVWNSFIGGDCMSEGYSMLSDVLVENSFTSKTQKSFSDWSTVIAEVIHGELESS